MKDKKLRDAATLLLEQALHVHDHIPARLMTCTVDGKLSCVADDFQKAYEAVAKALSIPLVYLDREGCTWNPDTSNNARAGDEHNAKVKATVKVGTYPYRLCDACANLPTFKRMRKRVPIKT